MQKSIPLMSTLVKREESNVDINLVTELEGTLNEMTVIGQGKRQFFHPIQDTMKLMS